MLTFVVVLAVIACIILAGIVLIQNSKGGGLASNFASSNQIMGVRKTTDFLEKATWSLAAFVMVLCFVCAFLVKNEFKANDPYASQETEQVEDMPSEE